MKSSRFLDAVFVSVILLLPLLNNAFTIYDHEKLGSPQIHSANASHWQLQSTTAVAELTSALALISWSQTYSVTTDLTSVDDSFLDIPLANYITFGSLEYGIGTRYRCAVRVFDRLVCISPNSAEPESFSIARSASSIRVPILPIVHDERFMLQYTYLQHVASNDGMFSLVVPTGLNAQQLPSHKLAPETDTPSVGSMHANRHSGRFLVELSLTNGNAQSLGSSSHELSVDRTGGGVFVTIRPGEQTSEATFFEVHFVYAPISLMADLTVTSIFDATATSIRNGAENRFLLSIFPPQNAPSSSSLRKHVVIVVQPNLLRRQFTSRFTPRFRSDLVQAINPQIVAIVEEVLRGMGTGDALDVIVMDRNGSSWNEQGSLLMSRDSSRAAVIDFLNGHADSASSNSTDTPLSKSLLKAFSLHHESTAQTVFLISDGHVELEENLPAIRPSGSLYVLGVGTKPDLRRLESVANLFAVRKEGSPAFFVWDGDDEANTKMNFRQTLSDLLGLEVRETRDHPDSVRPVVLEAIKKALKDPILVDLKIEVEGFHITQIDESYDRFITDQPLLIAGRWVGSKTGRIFVSGRTDRTVWKQTLQVSDSAVIRNDRLMSLHTAFHAPGSESDLRLLAPSHSSGLRHEVVRKSAFPAPSLLSAETHAMPQQPQLNSTTPLLGGTKDVWTFANKERMHPSQQKNANSSAPAVDNRLSQYLDQNNTTPSPLDPEPTAAANFSKASVPNPHTQGEITPSAVVDVQSRIRRKSSLAATLLNTASSEVRQSDNNSWSLVLISLGMTCLSIVLYMLWKKAKEEKARLR
eukprot:GILJ01004060.1.p1 GENE.GILJ01004060.1~~GILJ01004060.1.p1  ORF type:complete len:809 (-),score=121.51 GILJ01004060.1:208-2634(-)